MTYIMYINRDLELDYDSVMSLLLKIGACHSSDIVDFD